MYPDMSLFLNKTLCLVSRFLVFVLLLANVGCIKDFSYEARPPAPVDNNAEFTLFNCSDATVTGSFVANTALGTDAIMTLTVNVTKTGDWSYNTQLKNGFQFSGAGTFTTIGQHVITLMAGGTPTAAGNVAFDLTIGNANCKVTVIVTTPGGGGVNPISQRYYKAIIDGVSYVQNVEDTGEYESSSGIRGADDVVLAGGITYANPPRPAGKTEFRIEIGTMHRFTTATPDQFRAFFTIGYHRYAPGNFNNGDGVKIYWTDGNGQTWETRDGNRDQAGSIFTITGKRDYVDAAGKFYQIVRATFKCNLYNVATGAMLPANGEAAVMFGML
jgi:hypothetical protein